MVELNELLAAAMATDDRRRIAHRPIAVGEHFELEAQVFAHRFQCGVLSLYVSTDMTERP